MLAAPERKMNLAFRAAAVVCLLLTAVCWSQTPSAPCVDASTLKDKERRGGIVAGAQRLIGAPSTTVDAPADANICPLTAHQKLNVWVQRSYSPANLLAAGVDAAVWQASDTDRHGFGQGWDAYGARYGAALATSESTQFFQKFLLPSILKEDPRYFRKSGGGFGARFGYAISRVLVGRTDSGHGRFNFSSVGGAFASAALSNTYLPDVNRDPGRTMASAGITLANTAGWNLLSEFGPDVWKKLRGKNKN
jgi:hypothetical protein